MITLITYLTWPKTMAFKGLNMNNMAEMVRYHNGPDYALAILLDACLIAIVGIGIYTIKNWKRL